MKKILLLFILFFINANIATAAIKIAPAIVEIDANKSKKNYISGAFSVAGGKDETIRFKIYPEFFEHNSKGNYVHLPDKGQSNSLMGKIKFYPTEFTCKNGVEQKVRFTITDIKSLPVGESRLALFLEDVKTKEVLIRRADGKIGGKIIVKTRIGIPIYINKGHYTKKGVIDTVTFDKKGNDYLCKYKILSKGNSRINYSGLCYISQHKKLIKKFKIKGSSVDPNKTLEKIQKINLSKNTIKEGEKYNVKFILTYRNEKNKEKILRKEFTFIPKQQGKTKI